MIESAPAGVDDEAPPVPSRSTRFTALALWTLALLAVLALAAALRLWRLDAIPPGLTHDEANHGREAIGILDGVYRYFFPLNYGSEPLYSYTVAGFMALLGRNAIAMRLVNVVFGLLAILMTVVWAGPRLGRWTALLGAALLAVGFWPLASSREALRAGMLPFFMTLAVWFFWRILESAPEKDAPPPRRLAWFVLGFAAALVATLHIYLAARVTWLLFPLFLVYLLLFQRAVFRRAWAPVLLGLAAAALLSIPMAVYLRAHPEMQTRLGMFGDSLGALGGASFAPLMANARDALLAFVWPGYGDQFLAYNIPGRPVFDALTAVFFLIGFGICLWRFRRPVYAFLPLWFLVGIAPSLITGPTANTTRNLAALPVVYLIPAVGFVVLAESLLKRRQTTDDRRQEAGVVVRGLSSVVVLLALLWLAYAGWTSGRDYFVRWGGSPDVRGAYQHTLVEMLGYLADHHGAAAPLMISSVYPGPVHDPSIALVEANRRPAIGLEARWADARSALLIPSPGAGYAAVPLSTPPHRAFDALLHPVDSLRLRPDDLDPGFTLYQFDGGGLSALVRDLEPPAGETALGGALELVGSRWLNGPVAPGSAADLLTVWRVLDPLAAGPPAPPSYTTDAVLFTHVLSEDGSLLAQRDALDAPSWSWQAGDFVLQIHSLAIPLEAAAGAYRAVAGLYDRGSGARLATGSGETVVPVAGLVIGE